MDWLLQQGIDDALEREKPTNIEEVKWILIKKKALITIQLVIAPEIKYHYLKESILVNCLRNVKPCKLLNPLEIIFFFRWELYQLMKDEDTTIQDYINTFNKLVCQLLNADEKLTDEEQALLLLASLPKDYRNIVHTLLIGRDSITLDQALATLKQNDMFMVRREGEENKCVGHRLYSEGSNRGRTKEMGYQARGKSQGRGDLSDKECYYCKKKGAH